MSAVNPHSIVNRFRTAQAVTGIDSSGNLDIEELDAGEVDVGADSFIFNDADDGATYEESIADLIAAAGGAGLLATAGVLSIDLDGLGDAEIDVGADTIPFIDESADGDPTKLESVADLIGKIVGTVTSTGLAASSGVASVSINGLSAKDPPVLADALALNDSEASNVLKKVTLTNLFELGTAIGSRLADDHGSLFYEAAEIDFGTANAVDTKITDAAVAKGKLVAISAFVTEAFDGDGDTTIAISSAASGATPMCSNITADKDAGENGNYIGAQLGAMPNDDDSEIVASGGDVYAYAAGVTSRSTGKLYIVLTFMKTA